MTSYFSLVFIAFISFYLGYWFGGRNTPASVFVEDSEEAEELREEGARAVSERIEKRKDRILAKAKAEGRITNDGVEELFCISDRTAGNYLRALVEEEKLEKVGTSGRGVYYTPK